MLPLARCCSYMMCANPNLIESYIPCHRHRLHPRRRRRRHIRIHNARTL